MERLSHIITDSLVALVILQALQQHDSQALEVHHLTIDLITPVCQINDQQETIC